MFKIMKRLFFLLAMVLLVGCNCLAQNVPDQLLVADENCEAVVPVYTDDVAVTDNCSPTTVITQSPTAGTIISASQVCTVTATDDAGNSSSITFNLIVDDQTPPVITPTGDLLSSLDSINSEEENLLTSN